MTISTCFCNFLIATCSCLDRLSQITAGCENVRSCCVVVHWKDLLQCLQAVGWRFCLFEWDLRFFLFFQLQGGLSFRGEGWAVVPLLMGEPLPSLLIPTDEVDFIALSLLTHWHPRPWTQTTPQNPDKMAAWVNSHTSVKIFQDFNAFPLSFCCKNSQKYYLCNKDLLNQLLSYRCARCPVPISFQRNLKLNNTFYPHLIRMLHKKGCYEILVDFGMGCWHHNTSKTFVCESRPTNLI